MENLSIETYIVLATILINFGISIGVQTAYNKYMQKQLEQICKKMDRHEEKLDKHNNFSDRLAILETRDESMSENIRENSQENLLTRKLLKETANEINAAIKSLEKELYSFCRKP